MNVRWPEWVKQPHTEWKYRAFLKFNLTSKICIYDRPWKKCCFVFFFSLIMKEEKENLHTYSGQCVFSMQHSLDSSSRITPDSSDSIIPLQISPAHFHPGDWQPAQPTKCPPTLSGLLPSPLLLLLVRLCCSPAPLASLQSLRGTEERVPTMEGDNIIMPVWLGDIFQGEFPVLSSSNRGGGNKWRGSYELVGGEKFIRLTSWDRREEGGIYSNVIHSGEVSR